MKKTEKDKSATSVQQSSNVVASTYKSADTEEWFDIVFNRPIGYQWALLFRRLGVHPNTVTVFSMILGAAAGVMFSFDADTSCGLLLNIIGVLLLMWANFYDSADGQLARLTGQKTQLGRILDGAGADVWYISIYFCLALRLFDKPIPFISSLGTEFSLFGLQLPIPQQWAWWGFALAAASGLLCHTPQCRLSDYYRNIHLFFLNAKNGSEFDRAAAQKKKYEEMPWKGNYVNKIFQWFYKNYTAAQEKSTPHFQAFWQKVQETYGNDIPQSLRDEFRRRSLPLMKYTNILTFNTRAFALYIACLIDQPWIYLLFELIVLTIICRYMHWQHERMSRKLLASLK